MYQTSEVFAHRLKYTVHQPKPAIALGRLVSRPDRTDVDRIVGSIEAQSRKRRKSGGCMRFRKALQCRRLADTNRSSEGALHEIGDALDEVIDALLSEDQAAKLAAMGYRGPVYGTAPTLEIAEVILRDSAKIQEERAERVNQEGYSKHKPAEPLYDTKSL